MTITAGALAARRKTVVMIGTLAVVADAVKDAIVMTAAAFAIIVMTGEKIAGKRFVFGINLEKAWNTYKEPSDTFFFSDKIGKISM